MNPRMGIWTQLFPFFCTRLSSRAGGKNSWKPFGVSLINNSARLSCTRPYLAAKFLSLEVYLKD